MRAFRLGLSFAFAATALAGGEAGAAIGWYVTAHRSPPVTLPVGEVVWTGPAPVGEHGYRICVDPYDQTVPAHDMADGVRGVCQSFPVEVNRYASQCESWMEWAGNRTWEPNETWRHRWPECSKRTVRP